MCNLYKLRRTREEVADLFRLRPGLPGNHGETVWPGTPGLVAAEGELRAMNWGFPLALTGKSGQKLKPRPVNNARTDKLSGPFWRASMAARRCLIPVTAYAEAEGPPGGKTRTWIAMPDGQPFACAGLWRASEEWGACYAMVITEACVAVQHVHHRMPAILPERDWEAWLGGTADEAAALCVPWVGELAVERTGERWGG